MQHLNSKLSLHSELTQSYLEGIRNSINHFAAIENHLNKTRTTSNYSAHFNEPLQFSHINYVAIMALEKLGLPEPIQAQIDIVETLILLACNKEHLTPEKFDLCTGADSVAKRILLRHLNKKSHSM